MTEIPASVQKLLARRALARFGGYGAARRLKKAVENRPARIVLAAGEKHKNQ